MSSNPYHVRLSGPTGAVNGTHSMKLRGDPDKLLFIVDPQNDFSDECAHRGNGSLSVAGSTADYIRIIEFLRTNDIQEVHVSLDTHSERHIAHPGFWDIFDGMHWVNATDNNSKLRKLSIDEHGQIWGTSFVDGSVYQLQPRNHNYKEEEYHILNKYVKDYISFFYKEDNSHLQPPMIWPNHCIEGTEGHKVASELHHFLEQWVNHVHGTGPYTKQRILRFHNKGRNNLVEMYSAFSSDKPITARETLKLTKIAYDGEGIPTFENNSTGHQTYESHNNNMNTDLNVPLIQHLLRNNNCVYFCGEARTHCVKSTLIDVMDVVEAYPDTYSRANVVLLKNMSSPIQTALDNIEGIMLSRGFPVISP